MGWTKRKKGRWPLWHHGVLVTDCGLPVVGSVFYSVKMPEDLGQVCAKCRRAATMGKKSSDGSEAADVQSTGGQ